ncbi:type II toxin-antitoxin system death-on-curing family toxin [Saccharopolyspora tripterygii]
MIYLTLDELLLVARRTLGGEAEVRDFGLLESALARPRATAFGEEVYPTLTDKASALLHSLARNHALVDGNERLALAATFTYLGINGRRLTFSNAEAYVVVMAVASGELDDVPAIAKRLQDATEPR